VSDPKWDGSECAVPIEMKRPASDLRLKVLPDIFSVLYHLSTLT